MFILAVVFIVLLGYVVNYFSSEGLDDALDTFYTIEFGETFLRRMFLASLFIPFGGFIILCVIFISLILILIICFPFYSIKPLIDYIKERY